MPGTCTSSENMKEMGRTVTERQKGYRGEACRAVSPSVTPQLVRLQGWRGTGGAMGRPRKFRSNLSCTHSLAPLWDCSCPAELPKTRLSGPCAKGVPTARDAWRHAEDLEVDQGGTQAGGTTLGGGSSVPRHCLSRGESASRVVSEGGGTRLGSGPGFRRVSRLWRRAPSAAPTSLGTLTRRGEDVAVLGPARRGRPGKPIGSGWVDPLGAGSRVLVWSGGGAWFPARYLRPSGQRRRPRESQGGPEREYQRRPGARGRACARSRANWGRKLGAPLRPGAGGRGSRGGSCRWLLSDLAQEPLPSAHPASPLPRAPEAARCRPMVPSLRVGHRRKRGHPQEQRAWRPRPGNGAPAHLRRPRCRSQMGRQVGPASRRASEETRPRSLIRPSQRPEGPAATDPRREAPGAAGPA